MIEEEILQIIDEENRKGLGTGKFIENAFHDGEIKTTGAEIDKLMPAVSRFGGGSRPAKKHTVKNIRVMLQISLTKCGEAFASPHTLHSPNFCLQHISD